MEGNLLCRTLPTKCLKICLTECIFHCRSQTQSKTHCCTTRVVSLRMVPWASASHCRQPIPARPAHLGSEPSPTRPSGPKNYQVVIEISVVLFVFFYFSVLGTNFGASLRSLTGLVALLSFICRCLRRSLTHKRNLFSFPSDKVALLHWYFSFVCAFLCE